MAVQYEGGGESLPELEVDFPERQRRLTVFFRALLLIPQFIVMFFLGIAAFVVTVIGWFGALILGRLPSWARSFLLGYLGYYTRVYGYYELLVDRYPSFSFDADDYPIRLAVEEERLNRLAVLFRIILIIPAWIVSSVISYGWGICSFICWLVVLILGRIPAPLFQATGAVLRYTMRYQAYLTMLTGRYPKRLFGEPAPEGGQVPRPGTRPLVVIGGARVILIIFIVLGVLGFLGSETANLQQTTTQTPEYSTSAP